MTVQELIDNYAEYIDEIPNVLHGKYQMADTDGKKKIIDRLMSAAANRNVPASELLFSPELGLEAQIKNIESDSSLTNAEKYKKHKEIASKVGMNLDDVKTRGKYYDILRQAETDNARAKLHDEAQSGTYYIADGLFPNFTNKAIKAISTGSDLDIEPTDIALDAINVASNVSPFMGVSKLGKKALAQAYKSSVGKFNKGKQAVRAKNLEAFDKKALAEAGKTGISDTDQFTKAIAKAGRESDIDAAKYAAKQYKFKNTNQVVQPIVETASDLGTMYNTDNIDDYTDVIGAVGLNVFTDAAGNKFIANHLGNYAGNILGTPAGNFVEDFLINDNSNKKKFNSWMKDVVNSAEYQFGNKEKALKNFYGLKYANEQDIPLYIQAYNKEMIPIPPNKSVNSIISDAYNEYISLGDIKKPISDNLYLNNIFTPAELVEIKEDLIRNSTPTKKVSDFGKKLTKDVARYYFLRNNGYEEYEPELPVLEPALLEYYWLMNNGYNTTELPEEYSKFEPKLEQYYKPK